ncbi:hypothetical protein PITC_090650 [Penicillium italicum]|uniref:DUF7136 domain-containing protein n=1 Tax=Penicillium italicum TaxID=40296 RepID=A0A0A2LC09_PENIT|nr:hypothetical protein PITC_090650 [Penicillium italicum]
MKHVRFLTWTALMAYSMIAMGNFIPTSNSGSGQFEIDLVFPRNETYAPQGAMAIVFALQNPTLALPLGATVSWSLWEGNNQSSPGSIVGGGLELSLLNLTSSDPMFVTRYIDTLNYPSGFWTLTWSVSVNNCIQRSAGNSADTVSNITMTDTKTTIFTISQSGQKPDLVASTSSDLRCSVAAQAFNVTSIGESCGFLGPSPTTNPCAVTINPSAASSISAAATAYACQPQVHPSDPQVSCPPITGKSSNDAAQSRMAAASTLFTLLTTVTALIHLG